LVLVPDLAQNQSFGFGCVNPVIGLCEHSNSPFDNGMVISIGFAVIIIIIIPMGKQKKETKKNSSFFWKLGYFNLEDNIFIQFIATAIQTLILFQWLVAFFLVFAEKGLQLDTITAFGTGEGQGLVEKRRESYFLFLC
jgi:hypothetical protein